VWERAEPCLRDLTFTVPQGKLVSVVGKVGSGKSSLLSALLGNQLYYYLQGILVNAYCDLGEMERVSGRVGVYGSVAYVSQQPWMQNQTVRSNITFGKRYNEGLYEEVLHACSLHQDLRMLSTGDMTEIGEKVSQVLVLCY